MELLWPGALLLLIMVVLVAIFTSATASTVRHPFTIRLKAGAGNDGRLTALPRKLERAEAATIGVSR